MNDIESGDEPIIQYEEKIITSSNRKISMKSITSNESSQSFGTILQPGRSYNMIVLSPNYQPLNE